MAKRDENQVLSKRELEVLQSVAKGLSNQEIARELIISVNTVRVHLRNIFEKLQVQSRTEAMMRGIQAGWIIAPGQDDDESSPAAPAAGEVFHLAGWQRLYLLVALAVAVLVLVTPVVKPMVQRSTGSAFSDVDLTEAAAVDNSQKRAEEWTLQAEMPAARSRLAVTAYNGLLYLIGGDRTSGTTGLVEVYDPETDTWQELSSKPTHSANIQAVVIDDEIFVAGGCTNTAQASSQLEIFDPAANQWRSAAPLPTALCAYAAAAHNGELVVIGGWNGTGYIDDVYIYNPDADSWRTAGSYPLAVGFAAAQSVDGKIYVAGGYDGSREYDAVNVLSPETGQWEPLPALNLPRGGLALVAVGNTLYALGGGWTDVLSANEKLALTGGDPSWQFIDTPYFDQWRNLGAAAIDSTIYAIGGWNNEHLNKVLAYKTVYRIFIPLTY